mmetsp:Transcript_78833/g.255387  ORF Transcript_78833/g.255387 Transcript_78833/m.255387 type:complete len:372 (-) Transcript_78833:73-1188(-)
MLRFFGKGRASAASPGADAGAAADAQGGDDAPAAAAGAEDACQMLVDMGFEKAQVEEVLKENGGDMSAAVVTLIGMTPAEAAASPGANSQTQDLSMEELDAALDEALKLSEQEAELEKKRREDERVALDAALAASLECMPAGPPPQGRLDGPAPASQASPAASQAGLVSPQARSPPWEQAESPQSRPPEAAEAGGRKGRRSRRASSRTGGRPAAAQEVAAATAMADAVVSGGFPSSPSGGLEQQRRSSSSGAAARLLLDQVERPGSRASGTGASGRNHHREINSRGSEEIVALDDLEGWTRGSGLCGVATLRSTYPARPLNVSLSRRQAPVLPPIRKSPGGQRPNSRAGQGAHLGSSSSSPLLAAGALSIT